MSRLNSSSESENGRDSPDSSIFLSESAHPSLVQLALFKFSWTAGTRYNLLRDPHTELYRDDANDTTLTLGSILLDNTDNADISPDLRKFTLQYFVEKSENADRSIVIIQVLEDFELTESPVMVGPALKAISLPRASRDGIDVALHRLSLVDFSADMTPTPDFINTFKAIYTAIKDLWSTRIYVHCKAGVNRSFRVASALNVLFELQKNDTRTLSDIEIVRKVIEVCGKIKENLRQSVSLDKDNYVKQISFITHLVLAGLEKPAIIDDEDMSSLIAQVRLEAYIKNRNAVDTPEYRSMLDRSFSSQNLLAADHPRSKTCKVRAAEKFLKKLRNEETEPYTKNEYRALKQGSLGHIVKSVAVKNELISYIVDRKRADAPEYKSVFASLFKSRSKTCKVAAAEKFLADYNCGSSEPYTADELDALSKGSLGDIVALAAQYNKLPTQYKKQTQPTTEDLVERLKQYQDARFAIKDEHTSVLSSLFVACSKTCKTDAVKKFLFDLNGCSDEIKPYSRDELTALSTDSLGDIIKLFEKNNALPVKYRAQMAPSEDALAATTQVPLRFR